MGKLSEWVEANTTITQEKFNENDITTNSRIKNLMFEQIEDLAFNVKLVKSEYYTDKPVYMLSFRLDFPRKTDTPYDFLFETGRNVLIPQYTETHRVYRAADDIEATILQNLECYLLQNPCNDTKDNPKNKRDRSQNFLLTQGEIQSDIVAFRFEDSNLWSKADGVFTLEYIGDSKPGEEGIVAYQHGTSEFTFTKDFRNLRLSRRETNGILEFYLYNIPTSLDWERFVMQAKF